MRRRARDPADDEIEYNGKTDYYPESPRRAVNTFHTHFVNPNLDNGDSPMRSSYSTSGGAGRERHASPGDEFGVPDTMKVPSRANAETGYMRPRNAESSGDQMSARAVFKYALKPRASYRER